MPSAIALRCTDCGATYDDSQPLWACPAPAERGACGGLLTVEYAWPPSWAGRRSEVLSAGAQRPGIWRYAPFLPVRTPDCFVSLGEGSTPLVPLRRWGERHGLRRAYAKLEYVSPTGSFKDRGAACLLAKAAEWGVRRVIEDSSGNAGAAIAAYSAQAGMASDVFVPATAPEGKVRPVERVGATLHRISGSRAAVTEAAVAAVAAHRAKPGAATTAGYYAGHNVNPYFLEGMKTAAYELSEAFAFQPPDHLILPVGGGSLYVGAWRGFQEWQSWGWIASCPRLHLAQSTGCAPLVEAVQQGSADHLPIDRRPTVAGGIEVEAPPRGRLILAALRQSDGRAVAVEDAAILEHRRLLATLEGLDVEPTAAVPLAGLAALARDGVVQPDETVVALLTGSGLKDLS